VTKISALTQAFALCLWLLSATTAGAGEAEWRDWAEAANKQHELAGRAYDVAGARLSSPTDGIWPLPAERIVLLGEVHDNPAHHNVRAWLIEAALLARPGWRPAVVFEQIRADQQAALDQFRALDEQCCRLTTAVDLFRLLQWDVSGWPPAEIYRPLFEAVVAGRLPIHPGDPQRERVRAVARGGLAALALEERARLRLDAPLAPALADALDRDLVDSHCGALPPQAIGGMAVAQRYRDAHLADTLLAAAERHGSAILIAGNGHVRSDRGVPWHIRQRASDARIVSVVLVEVEDGRTEPTGYLPRDPEGRPAADFAIFTPRAKRGDPCEGLRRKSGFRDQVFRTRALGPP
jgi:uncharacterized iron-regulated protein